VVDRGLIQAGDRKELDSLYHRVHIVSGAQPVSYRMVTGVSLFIGKAAEA